MQVEIENTNDGITNGKNVSMRQYVVDLEIGDVVEVKINGVSWKTYTAAYENCHFNFIIQDREV